MKRDTIFRLARESEVIIQQATVEDIIGEAYRFHGIVTRRTLTSTVRHCWTNYEPIAFEIKDACRRYDARRKANHSFTSEVLDIWRNRVNREIKPIVLQVMNMGECVA